MVLGGRVATAAVCQKRARRWPSLRRQPLAKISISPSKICIAAWAPSWPVAEGNTRWQQSTGWREMWEFPAAVEATLGATRRQTESKSLWA